MTLAPTLEILDVLEAISFDDYGLFRQRQSLVASLGLDERDIVARIGTLQVTRLAFHGRHFDTEIQGIEPEPAVVIGVLDVYERWLDLAAWPLGDPTRMASLLGNVAMLGEHQLDAASPWGPPMPLYRSVIAWLRAGCVGVVPLDPIRAARVFIDFDGTLVAEHLEHARELALARAALVDRSPAIVVAEPARRAA